MMRISFLASGLIVGALALAALMGSVPVRAVEYFGLDVAADKSGYSSGPEITATSLTATIVSRGLELLVILFFVLALYGGLRWMTAGGDEEAATKAKDILEAAVIGFVLVIAAYGIATFIFSRLADLPPGEGGIESVGGGAGAGPEGPIQEISSPCHDIKNDVTACRNNQNPVCQPVNAPDGALVCMSKTGYDSCLNQFSPPNCKDAGCTFKLDRCFKTTP